MQGNPWSAKVMIKPRVLCHQFTSSMLSSTPLIETLWTKKPSKYSFVLFGQSHSQKDREILWLWKSIGCKRTWEKRPLCFLYFMKDVFSSFLSIQENRQIVIEFLTKNKSTNILEWKMQETTESVRYAELRDFHYANILTTKTGTDVTSFSLL